MPSITGFLRELAFWCHNKPIQDVTWWKKENCYNVYGDYAVNLDLNKEFRVVFVCIYIHTKALILGMSLETKLKTIVFITNTVKL